MKILVCISRTPDTTAKIAFTDNNTKFATDGVQWIINPYDEWYALVKAIELKEQEPSNIIHLINVGGVDNEPILRKALALGGDEGIRVNCMSEDAYVISSQIAAIAQQETYDLILLGKETIDHNGASIGGMVAEMLDVNMVSLSTGFQVNGITIEATREIEGGEEIVLLDTPCVITCQKGMAEARIPNMRGIMAARTKPLKVVEAVEVTPLTETISFELPASKAGVKLVPADQPEMLIKLLKEEAKTI
jgi:electron transfer flavoprotein beta subunit